MEEEGSVKRREQEGVEIRKWEKKETKTQGQVQEESKTEEETFWTIQVSN